MKLLSRFNQPGFIRGKVYEIEREEKFVFTVIGEDDFYAFHANDLESSFNIVPDNYVPPTVNVVNLSEIPEQDLLDELIRRGTLKEIDITVTDNKVYFQKGANSNE